ncbi:MAG: hypothetical protein M1130_05810 [Actinobacteria bacterium]|nr:hypothetical protein [Actinomycetota bacterium]
MDDPDQGEDDEALAWVGEAFDLDQVNRAEKVEVLG